MPPPGGRAGSICVYVVSSLLLLAIVVGGAFLVLYITLPETPATAWFPAAGMSLVATPWIFWIVMFLYRVVSLQKVDGGVAGPDRAPATPPAAVAVDEDQPAVDSPGGGRRVRFGAVTVVGSSTDFSGGGSGSSLGGSSEKAEVASPKEGDEAAHATAVSSAYNEEESSLTSHDSEPANCHYLR